MGNSDPYIQELHIGNDRRMMFKVITEFILIVRNIIIEIIKGHF